MTRNTRENVGCAYVTLKTNIAEHVVERPKVDSYVALYCLNNPLQRCPCDEELRSQSIPQEKTRSNSHPFPILLLSRQPKGIVLRGQPIPPSFPTSLSVSFFPPQGPSMAAEIRSRDRKRARSITPAAAPAASAATTTTSTAAAVTPTEQRNPSPSSSTRPRLSARPPAACGTTSGASPPNSAPRLNTVGGKRPSSKGKPANSTRGRFSRYKEGSQIVAEGAAHAARDQWKASAGNGSPEAGGGNGGNG